MDIEEAKDILLNVVADEVVGVYCQEIQKTTDCAKNCENNDCFVVRAIETVLKELELKDKIIDKMAEQLAGIAIYNNRRKEPIILGSKEEVIEYYKEQGWIGGEDDSKF